MECEIKWNGGDGISFTAKTGSGHLIALDTAKDVSGATAGPRPMEAFLVGAVACTQYDVVAGIKQSGGILHSCKALAVKDIPSPAFQLISHSMWLSFLFTIKLYMYPFFQITF